MSRARGQQGGKQDGKKKAKTKAPTEYASSVVGAYKRRARACCLLCRNPRPTR
jgi:hypothetical protein